MHIPVLQKEVIKYLNPKKNENFIDCTIGEGGHSLAILEKTAPQGKILGIDWDPNQIENCKLKIGKFKKRVILVCDNFANLEEIVKREKFKNISGILFDLGFSTWHLEKSGRGFSFLKKEPLDMRYNLENPLTAEKILNYWSENDLEKIIREYSQEKFAKEIARKIIETRKIKPIKNTFQLVEIIKQAVPKNYEKKRIHPATRTFQALRIAVNDELNNLKKGLEQSSKLLMPGGRLVVISFHSLEEKIVKQFFKEKCQTPNSYKNLKNFNCKILTKKPIIPNEIEIKINPQSRSAKLRAILKI